MSSVKILKTLLLLNLVITVLSLSNQSLEDIRDIIIQSKPQIIQVISKLENQQFSAFTMKFLDLFTNSNSLWPIIVQTFSNASVLTYNDTRVNMGYEKVIVQILNDNSEHSIKECGSVLHKKLKRKQLNRFVVIIEKISTRNSVWLKNLFKEFEQKKILDVMVFFFIDDLKIFRYNPFLSEQQQLLSMNQTTAKDEYQTLYVIKNLNGIEFKGVVLPAGYALVKAVDESNRTSYHGTNINMSNLLAERMNINMQYVVVDPRAADTIAFAEDQLKTNNNVFVLLHLSYNKQRFDNIAEASGNFYQILFLAMVPEAGSLPSYQNIYFTLTGESWIFVAVSILVMTLIQKSFELFYRKTTKTSIDANQKDRPLWKSFLYTIQAFVGDSITKVPQAPSARLILLGWILYSYLVTSAFTAKLLSSLISPRQEDNIDTLDQLFKSNLEICAPTEIKPNFEQYVYKNIREKFFRRPEFTPFNNITKRIDMTLPDRKSAFVMAEYILNQFIVKYYDKVNQKPYFHKMKEGFMYFPGVYLIQRGSPHLEYINYLLGMFHQFGFYVCWEEMAAFKESLGDSYESQQIDDESDSSVTLTKDHLQTVFYVWSLGIICAMFSLVGELLMSYYKKKTLKRKRIVKETRNTAN